MADLQQSYPKAQSFPAESAAQANSFSQYFSKFLFFALFLIAIPLFPAQAPDLINKSLLTNFWELVHLLFIGVAVSYGLFCRRSVDTEVDSYSGSDDSESYVSRVLCVSSIFEDGYYSSCGYVGNNHVYYKNETVIGAIDEQGKPMYENRIGNNNRFGYNENNVIQAWNSQYFQGESMVIVAQPDYNALNGYGESGLTAGHIPLGLPVRSLKSSVADQDSSEIINPNLDDSSNSPSENFGDMGPINLEDKFNETFAKSSSSSSWRSRSGRVETRENTGIAMCPSHLRPLSVDETQLESLKTNSLWSSESFSSQTSSNSDSPKVEDLKMEELGKGKSFGESYPPNSPPADVNDDDDHNNNSRASFNAFHLRRYCTNGSLFDKKSRKSLDDDLKKSGLSKSSKREEDLSGCKAWMMDNLKFSASPVNVVKASSRGKSVRTIRARKFASEAAKVVEKHENHVIDKIGKMSDEVEALFKCKNEKKNGEFDSSVTAGARKLDLGKNVSTQKPTFSKYQKRKHKEHSENMYVESTEESESEGVAVAAEKTKDFSDEEVENNDVSDVGPNSNEVDKKASEFIAKFREQIRLQKMASVEKSRRRNIAANSFR